MVSSNFRLDDFTAFAGLECLEVELGYQMPKTDIEYRSFILVWFRMVQRKEIWHFQEDKVDEID